jgi:hypothetical protein
MKGYGAAMLLLAFSGCSNPLVGTWKEQSSSTDYLTYKFKADDGFEYVNHFIREPTDVYPGCDTTVTAGGGWYNDETRLTAYSKSGTLKRSGCNDPSENVDGPDPSGDQTVYINYAPYTLTGNMLIIAVYEDQPTWPKLMLTRQ